MQKLAAVILAAALSLAAGGGPFSPERPSAASPSAAHTLAQPVYPDFPTLPQGPEDGDWSAYYAALNSYEQACQAIRGDGISPETRSALSGFAARSTSLALAGMDGKNTVYSPISLWSSLAMLAQCASGESRAQVLSSLGVDSIDTLRSQVSQIWKGLYTDDGASTLLLANSIWLNSSLEGTYVPETLSALETSFYTGAYTIPMGTDGADQAVTDWVRKQTCGLIGSGNTPVVKTKPETLALLASSLYYKAGWRDAFPPHLTQPDTFTAADGVQSQVNFMHRTENAPFLDRANYQAASLSTSLGEMIFILPDQGTTPEQLLSDPSLLPSLDFSAQDARQGQIHWSVPKFDVNSTLGLMDTLEVMGIRDLLDASRADLSSLTTLDAYLSDAKQLARVKVDEEGVEAAAVTILTMDTTAIVAAPQQVIMDLDRPFLFVIRTEGIPLFIGVVNEVEE